jgi:hypothetical protein
MRGQYRAFLDSVAAATSLRMAETDGTQPKEFLIPVAQ